MKVFYVCYRFPFSAIGSRWCCCCSLVCLAFFMFRKLLFSEFSQWSENTRNAQKMVYHSFTMCATCMSVWVWMVDCRLPGCDTRTSRDNFTMKIVYASNRPRTDTITLPQTTKHLLFSVRETKLKLKQTHYPHYPNGQNNIDIVNGHIGNNAASQSEDHMCSYKITANIIIMWLASIWILLLFLFLFFFSIKMSSEANSVRHSHPIQWNPTHKTAIKTAITHCFSGNNINRCDKKKCAECVVLCLFRTNWNDGEN